MADLVITVKRPDGTTQEVTIPEATVSLINADRAKQGRGPLTEENWIANIEQLLLVSGFPNVTDAELAKALEEAFIEPEEARPIEQFMQELQRNGLLTPNSSVAYREFLIRYFNDVVSDLVTTREDLTQGVVEVAEQAGIFEELPSEDEMRRALAERYEEITGQPPAPEDLDDLVANPEQAIRPETFVGAFARLIPGLRGEFTDEEIITIGARLKQQFDSEIALGRDVRSGDFITNAFPTAEEERARRTEEVRDRTIEQLIRSGDFDRVSRLIGPPPGSTGGESFSESLAEFGIEDLTELSDDEVQQITIDKIAAFKRADELRKQAELESGEEDEGNITLETTQALIAAQNRADELFDREQRVRQQKQTQETLANLTRTTRGSVRFSSSIDLDAFLRANAPDPEFAGFVRGRIGDLRNEFSAPDTPGFGGRPFSEFISSRLSGLQQEFAQSRVDDAAAQERRVSAAQRRSRSRIRTFTQAPGA